MSSIAVSHDGSQPVEVFQRQYLAPAGQQQFFHVLAADAEAAAADAGDDFVLEAAGALAALAQLAQVLDAGGLVAGGAIVLGDLRLNNDLSGRTRREQRIGALIETRNPVGSFGSETESLCPANGLPRKRS